MRLIEQVWFNDHQAKYWLLPLLWPFSLLFCFISALRRAFYRIGIFKPIALDKPVIVVGNISVGGNGKTPMVLWLINHYQQLGLKVGVISRGYGGKAEAYPLLLDENTSTAQAGDEAVMIYQRTQVALAVGSDRVASAKLLIAKGCDIIISDDGLQHYRLARDSELIIIDGQRGFGNQYLLPAGPLREGLWRLNQADHVIINGESSPCVQRILTTQAINATTMQLKVSYVCNLKTNEKLTVQDFAKQYAQVNAVAGIGAPQRFFDTLTAQQITLVQTKSFNDHHCYQAKELALLGDKLPLLMTEKDAVKCRGFAQDHWWYLAVDAKITPELKLNIKPD